MPGQSPKPDSPTLAADVIAQLGKDKQVHLELAGGGRLQLDRRLPFLCVYRRPADDDPGTEELVTSEMAYMVIPAEARPARQALELLRSIVEQLSKHFGAFLLVEIWSAPLADRHDSDSSANGSAASVSPRFEVVAPVAHIPRKTVEALSKSLGKHSLPLGSARVALAPPERLSSHGMKPLAKIKELKAWNAYFIGIKVRPVYRDVNSLEIFPVELHAIRRTINNAFKQAFFSFTRRRTALRLAHYQALGGHSVAKEVLEIDRQLADIDRSFDLLLQATPVNAENAWREFRRSRFDKPPRVLLPAAGDRSDAAEAAAVLDSGRADRRSDAVLPVSPEAGRARSADHAALGRRYAAIPAREPADLRRRFRLAARACPGAARPRADAQRARIRRAAARRHRVRQARTAGAGLLSAAVRRFLPPPSPSATTCTPGMMVSGDQLLDRRQDARAAAARRRAAAA